MVDILFLLAAFVAEICGTVAGFGSSTIFLPLALLFIDYRAALVLVAVMHIYGNITKMFLFHRSVNFNFLYKFGIASVIFALPGAYLVSLLPQDTMKALLGVMLAIYAVESLLNHNLRLKPQTRNIIVAGGMSGFFTGLIGTGGALRGAMLTAFNLPKNGYIATAAALAILVDLTRIPVYLTQGFLGESLYVYLPLLIVPAILGSFVGRLIVNRIPQEKFKRIVLIAIFIVGISFIL